jgi:hypothetical protein
MILDGSNITGNSGFDGRVEVPEERSLAFGIRDHGTKFAWQIVGWPHTDIPSLTNATHSVASILRVRAWAKVRLAIIESITIAVVRRLIWWQAKNDVMHLYFGHSLNTVEVGKTATCARVWSPVTNLCPHRPSHQRFIQAFIDNGVKALRKSEAARRFSVCDVNCVINWRMKMRGIAANALRGPFGLEGIAGRAPIIVSFVLSGWKECGLYYRGILNTRLDNLFTQVGHDFHLEWKLCGSGRTV